MSILNKIFLWFFGLIKPKIKIESGNQEESKEVVHETTKTVIKVTDKPVKKKAAKKKAAKKSETKTKKQK